MSWFVLNNYSYLFLKSIGPIDFYWSGIIISLLLTKVLCLVPKPFIITAAARWKEDKWRVGGRLNTKNVSCLSAHSRISMHLMILDWGAGGRASESGQCVYWSAPRLWRGPELTVQCFQSTYTGGTHSPRPNIAEGGGSTCNNLQHRNPQIKLQHVY